jgi:hypothetical protein
MTLRRRPRASHPRVHLQLDPEVAAAVTPQLIRAVEELIRAAGPTLQTRAEAAGRDLLTAVVEAKHPGVAETVAAILMEAGVGTVLAGETEEDVVEKETEDDPRLN